MPRIVKLKPNEGYKYYRFVAPYGQKIHLATCIPFTSKNKKADAISEATVEYWISPDRKSFTDKKVESHLLMRVLDEDPLTFIDPDSGLKINYKFHTSQTIDHFKIQPRNDDNYIRVGDKYELFYWDKSWKSLGIQIAEKPVLRYLNVPKGALYWLKNLTRGKEEQVFLLSEDGLQMWPGNETTDKLLADD